MTPAAPRRIVPAATIEQTASVLAAAMHAAIFNASAQDPGVCKVMVTSFLTQFCMADRTAVLTLKAIADLNQSAGDP